MCTDPNIHRRNKTNNEATSESTHSEVTPEWQSSNADANARLGELIEQLPDEVLSEIFAWYCPTLTNRFCAPPMSALLLSHVCTHWRKIAFSTPSLWMYTSLGAPRHHCESATELMLLWTKNAKTCPLVVDVDFVQFASFKQSDAVLGVVLEMIDLAREARHPSPTVERKKGEENEHVALYVSVQPSVAIRFPYVIEEYHWTDDDDVGENEDDLSKEFAPKNSMQLRVTTKPCILLGMEGQRSFGPYLVHLDLRDEEEGIWLTMEEALDIIHVYPNLRHLAFRLGYGGDDAGDVAERRGEVCALLRLKTLAVTWSDAEDVRVDPSSFLDTLSAPSLRNLELDGRIPARFIDMNGPRWLSIRQFIFRSTPPLRTLDLYKIRCDDVDLLGCLGRCLSLERLWMEECTVEERLVADLMEGHHPLAEAAQSTLQNLRTLGLVKCSVFDGRRFFESFVATGLVWRITALQGLYVSNCSFNEGISKTWHLLRSRYEVGAYHDLI